MAGFFGATPRRPTALARNTTQIKPEATVEGRMTGLLSKDSPYMRQAETRGLQQANARGLLSSSMAVGAVEGQRINAALPIAQQDAGLYGQAALQDSRYRQAGGLANQQYGNTASLADQQFGNTRSLIGVQGDDNRQTQRAGFLQNRTLARDNFGYSTNLQAQGIEGQSRMAREGFGYKTQLQGQQGDIQSRLAREGFGYDRDLQAQGIEGQSRLSAQGFSQNTQLQSQQGDINSRLSAQGFGQDSALQGQQGQIQSGLSSQNYAQTNALNNQQNAFAGEQNARAAVAQADARYAAAEAAIMSDPNMNPEQQAAAIRGQRAIRQSSITIATRGTQLQGAFTFRAPTTPASSLDPDEGMTTPTREAAPGKMWKFINGRWLEIPTGR